jgi:uncharacterized protein YegP (UPF0339 family)
MAGTIRHQVFRAKDAKYWWRLAANNVIVANLR